MGQCCGLEKRVQMAEIGAGAHTTDNKDNPYLELKDDKGYPNVSA